MNHGIWVEEYAVSRYLRKQTDEELKRRYEVLTSNLWSTDPSGNVTPPHNPRHREGLLRLIAHILCEQCDRTGSPIVSFDEAAMRGIASAAFQPPRLKTAFVGSPSCFAKFGKRDHIRNAFKNGVLHVAPARSFNDSSLNDAQRDDELLHWARTPNEQLLMRVYGRDANGAESEIPIQTKELLRGMDVPDFYVWCCGFGYDARLFHEFEADAVLVIRNMDEFRSRFSIAVEKELPGWTMKDGPLEYYDPYNICHEQLVPIFVKNIRYLHQNEYRFAWVPPDGATTSAPMLLTLGPLSDIAEYYEIDAAP